MRVFISQMNLDRGQFGPSHSASVCARVCFVMCWSTIAHSRLHWQSMWSLSGLPGPTLISRSHYKRTGVARTAREMAN